VNTTCSRSSGCAMWPISRTEKSSACRRSPNWSKPSHNGSRSRNG